MQVTRQPRIVSSTTCDMNMVDSGMQKINCQYNSQSHNSLASHVTTHVHIVLSTIQCKLYINQCMSTIGIDIYNCNNLFLPWKWNNKSIGRKLASVVPFIFTFSEHTHTLYCFREVGDFPVHNAQQTQVSHVASMRWVEVKSICLYEQHIHEGHYVHPVVMSTTRVDLLAFLSAPSSSYSSNDVRHLEDVSSSYLPMLLCRSSPPPTSIASSYNHKKITKPH